MTIQSHRGRTVALVVLLMLAAGRVSLAQQNFRVLVDFNSSNGATPEYGGLIEGPAGGDLYGTTSSGGANASGTIFKVSTTGTLRTVYSFCSQPDCADGAYPNFGLVLGLDGNFYGTTEGGGNYTCRINSGCGTAFKITPSGVLTTLYSFCAQPNCTDGVEPSSGLIQGLDGNFYGTTWSGGTYYWGSLFRITPSGELTTVHSFCTTDLCPDGGEPWGDLIQAADGNLYGSTYFGGQWFGGTVYSMTPAGTLTTLYMFCSKGSYYYCRDGEYPMSGVIQGNDGNFYGTTESGGANTKCYDDTIGCGTVFKLTADGTLTTLYSFCANNGCADGALPFGGLTVASDGNLYGTTTKGGSGSSSNCASGCGTVFRITPTGSLITLHEFRGKDGSYPIGSLFQFTGGTFYGTAAEGGNDQSCSYSYSYGCGTVFSLRVGLGPFAETVSSSSNVEAELNADGSRLP